jgi:hypothetical protein
MRYLSVEHGAVTLGDVTVAGVLQRLTVGGRVRYDEAEQDGLSGKTRTPMGWEDADITATLLLTTGESGTCYHKARQLARLFKGHDQDGDPQVYRVANAHLAAHDVDEVVFEGLTTEENVLTDAITATLRFREYTPAIMAAETRSTFSDAVKIIEPVLSDVILGGR